MPGPVWVWVALMMTDSGGMPHLSAIRSLAASAISRGITMRSQVTTATRVEPLSMTSAFASSSSSTSAAYRV